MLKTINTPEVAQIFEDLKYIEEKLEALFLERYKKLLSWERDRMS